jgi:DNA-binding SARP family transcriptional activator/WD40 repeat protein
VGIHALGTVHVDGGEALRPRDRRVLGALVARRDQVMAPDEIADAAWPEGVPASWAKQVQICIARLRKVLGADSIETQSVGYRLVSHKVLLDVLEFEEHVARARTLVETGEPDRAAPLYARALALFRGEPFSGLDGWPPALTEAARLKGLCRDVEDELLEARLTLGEHREVAPLAQALVADDPLREGRWATLALAEYRCGRQADALATLRQARALLREQLGIDPGPELRTLEDRILRQDPELRAVAVRRTVSADCPYKGLAPLESGDPLFGRDAEVGVCVDRLRTARLLVVAGPSGSGKSSLVRAGVVPELERRGRHCTVVVPAWPGGIQEPDAAESPLLVVDQLEELFSSGRTASEQREVLGRLAAYAEERAPVVLVVRGDHVGDLALEPALGRLAEENLHLLGPLVGDALREAIVRPAEDAGLRLESGLVELVMRDVEGEPGALPLMSHALAETWLRRDGAVLTVEAYRATGGIRGAVARSADRLYETLPADQRQVLRSVLLRLVAPSPDGEPVRARVASHALLGSPERATVLDRLVQARLVTVEEQVVEISHEALARAWPRLQSWLEDDHASQRVLRHLAAAADGWESLGRPDSELYRGARLEAAEEYRRAAARDLAPTEHAFLDTSLRLAEDERAALRDRVRRNARQSRRLRMLLSAAVCLALVAAVAGAVALDQKREAQVAGDEAQLEALVNRAIALTGTDRDVAALLAVEAARRWPSDPRAHSALLSIFTGAPGYLGHRYIADADRLQGALVPGTTTAVVALDGVRPVQLDVGSGKVVRRFSAPDADGLLGQGVLVSADGRRAVHLLASVEDRCWQLGGRHRSCGEAVVYDVATGAPLGEPIRLPSGTGLAALDRDGSLLAVTSTFDGAVTLHDAADGRVLGRIPALRRPADVSRVADGRRVGAVTFAPDGLLYVGSLAGPVRVVDPATPRVVRTLDAPPYRTNVGLAVGSDGVLVAAGQHGLVALDSRTGRRLWNVDLRGVNPDPCPWFAVSEAAQRVYCGTYYGEIEERDRRSGQRTGIVLDTQLGSVGDLALASDRKELVAFGSERPVITRWRIDGSGPVTRRVADGYLTADSFDFEGGPTMIVSRRVPTRSTADGREDYAVWDVETDRAVDELDLGLSGMGWVGPGVVGGMDEKVMRSGYYDLHTDTVVDGPQIGPKCEHLWVSAGGAFSYCGGLNGEVWVIDTATQRVVPPVLRLDGWIRSVSATRGGRTIVVTGAADDGPRTWVVDGRTREILAGPASGPDTTSVSLDGVLVGTTAGRITRYDLGTLEPLGDLPGAHGEVNTMQFSDDGRTLLATSNDQSASLYDVGSGTRLGDPIPTDAPLIYPAYLAHDGRSVAVTVADGIALWDLDPERLLAAACDVAGRNLTATEWSTYLAGVGDYRSTCPGMPRIDTGASTPGG